jgi:hypothetical protein
MQNLTITDQLVYSTVRIECDFPDGKSGTGTGFFMHLCVDGDTAVPVIVSNRHVVKGASVGRFVLTLKDDEGKPVVGQHKLFSLPNFGDSWIYHKDLDLAIMPIGPLLNAAAESNESFFYVPLEKNLIPSEAELQDMSSMQEIVMIGYPNGLWDHVNNQPIFRKGITATHPELNYNGKPEFLIDAACYDGSSGSPVFQVDIGKVTTRGQGTTIGPSKVRLLGILYAGPQHVATGEIKAVEIGGRKEIAVTGIPNNLGIVIRSRALLDFEAHVQFIMENGSKPKRNAPCPCGSGNKYKGCCGRIV